MNKLANENSPYLLEHSNNPVDWNPWSDEAFNLAKKEDKPVFLSIGYSSCHWCHVMEQESFTDPEVAKRMNSTFVCSSRYGLFSFASLFIICHGIFINQSIDFKITIFYEYVAPEDKNLFINLCFYMRLRLFRF